MTTERLEAQEAPPKYLYKYVKPERTDIIESGKILFSHPNQFDDVNEMDFEAVPATVRYLKEKAHDLQKMRVEELGRQFPNLGKRKRWEIARRETAHGLPVVIRDRQQSAMECGQFVRWLLNCSVAILCLSEAPDLDLMWAHYADGHTGFVIELDTSAEGFSELGIPIRIEYSDDRPKYRIGSGGSDFWKTKRNKWAYQREWRIFRDVNTLEKIDGSPTRIFSKLSTDLISGIFFGCRASNELREKIKGLSIGKSILFYDVDPKALT